MYIKRNLKKIRQTFLKYNSFSIISNNCWGGVIYKYFGMSYGSPTAGLIIPPNDYNRFCSNITKYKKLSVSSLEVSNSNNKELFTYLEEIHGNLVFGKCGDVEICFLHYKTFDEAVSKWERRMQRINEDNIIYKNNDNNGLTIDLMKEWCEVTKDKNTIFITCSKELYDLNKSKIKILYDSKIKGQNCVDDTTRFIKDYNVVKVINSLLKNNIWG